MPFCFDFQGLLPMQLMIQVSPDRFNRCILADAKEVDVMVRVERSAGSDIMTIRFTSYEWNARKFIT